MAACRFRSRAIVGDGIAPSRPKAACATSHQKPARAAPWRCRPWWSAELRAHRLRQAEELLQARRASFRRHRLFARERMASRSSPTRSAMRGIGSWRRPSCRKSASMICGTATPRSCSASNIHPKIVSERLGHSRVALTMDTYSHVIPGMQEEAAAAIDAAFGTALNKSRLNNWVAKW